MVVFSLGYVYVVSEPDCFLVKIGYSRQPIRRVRKLGLYDPVIQALFISIDAFGLERMLHENYAQYQLGKDVGLGREWFALPAEELAALKAASDFEPIPVSDELLLAAHVRPEK